MIPLEADQFRHLSDLIGREAGLHLPDNKRVFVASRLQRRLRARGMADFDRYVALVTGTDDGARDERSHMVSALTTNVTSIYRESHHFVLLARHLLELGRNNGRPIRIWSAGCSTGEEPLSIAAVCLRVYGPAWHRSVRILGSDIDRAVIDTAAARGADPALNEALATRPPSMPGSYTLRPEGLAERLLTGITYLPHNLLTVFDAPDPFDVIFCRNVTIYFDRDVQDVVHRNLVDLLRPGGFLALGHSERLRISRDLMTPIGPTAFVRPLQTEKKDL